MKNGKNDGISIYVNQEEFERNLPPTVELLKTNEGHKVFVVGTVHFSRSSQDDVSIVMRNTKPTVVMLELCPLRRYILEFDEETLLREASSLNTQKIREIIATKGLLNGMFYLSFLRTNASITKQLGVAPGGECRRAVYECQRLKTCKIVLGDRSIEVTMQRALKPLNWKQKLQLSNIFNDPTISKITPADVEAFKSRDTDHLKNLRIHFPSVYRSFVTERDQILAHNLLLSTKISGNPPSNIVGVVGMGHMNGIREHFGRTNHKEIAKIMKKDMESTATDLIFTKFLKFFKLLKHK